MVANISTVSSGKPFGSDSTLIEEIADPVKIGFNIPESITFLLTESTSFRVGAVAYPSPPFVTNIWSIVFKFSNTIVGETFALGLSVLSEE